MYYLKHIIFINLLLLSVAGCTENKKQNDKKMSLEKAVYIFCDSSHEKCGLMDADGNELTLPKYDFKGKISEDLMLVFDKKYGFLDLYGKFAVDPVYEKLRPFSNGYAEVKIKNKWGYLNKKGVVEIPAIYDDVWPFNKNGTAWVAENGKYCLIDQHNQKILNCEYDKGRNSNNIFYTYRKSNDESELFDISGKSLMKKKGSGLLFDKHEGMSVFKPSSSESVMFNENNDIVLKGDYKMDTFFYNGVIEVVFPENKRKYLDNNGKFIEFKEYLKRTGYFKMGEKYKFWHRSGKSWIIDQNGEFIYTGDELSPVSENVFLIKDGKDRLYSPPSTYFAVENADELIFSGTEGFIFFESSGKMGVANQKGEMLVSAKFDDIKGQDPFNPSDKGVFRVKKGELWGVIDTKGNEVFSFRFDKIEPFYDGEAFAYVGDLTYVLTVNGHVRFKTKHSINRIF